MQQIKFSLIIPAYNIENYIVKCITSILNQNYFNYEIIVVNDGSTDDTVKILESIKNEKIKIINKQNGGLSSARNEGLRHATGDYIWFVDGDDYIENNALEILYKCLKEEFYDIISFKYFKEFEKIKVIQNDKIDLDDAKQYPLVNTSTCTKIFNKEFFINNSFLFDEGRIYEDLSLIPFVMCMTDRIKFIDYPLYTYTYRKESIMNLSKKFNFNRDDKFFAIDMLYNRFEDKKLEKAYKEELEYLTIKHLLIVYSTEILPFGSKIYKNRCKKVLEYLKNINKQWDKNKYLKKSSLTTRIYVKLFKHKFFYLCKLALIIKK